jgi:predicted AAA+ superfamily ATPase
MSKLIDVLGYRTELRYIRDDSGKECDFVVLKDRKPLFAVECKLSDTDISPSLLHFKAKLNIPKWYQVHLGEQTKIISPDYSILPFDKFCKELELI